MIIGSADDIKNATLGEIRKFWERYYRASNAVLSITGDIDYNKTEDLVRKYYGEFDRKDKPAKPAFDEIISNGA